MATDDDTLSRVTGDNTSRRTFLKYTGATSAVTLTGLAGCLGNGDDDDDPADDSDDGVADDSDDADDADDSDDGDDDYPTERIRLIIPFSEGGGTDTWHRQFIPEVSDNLGVPVEIDNVPGAASLRGTGELVRSDGDGQTYGAFNPPSTPVSEMINPQDWDMASLEGVCRYAMQSYVYYVNPDIADDLGIEDLNDVAEAYQSGDLEIHGGQQRGGVIHVMATLLRNMDEYNLAWDRFVGYDGGGPMVQAVAAGEIPTGVTTPASGVGAIESGDVRVIATMSEDRDPMVGDVPSVTEQGFPGIDFIGLLQRCQWAPDGTSESQRATWADAMEEALESDRVQSWLDDTGNETAFAGPEVATQALQDAYEVIPENVDLDAIREDLDDS